jgi:hypothetical protein
MSKQLPRRLAVACASVLACAATVAVGSASASTEVAYNNLNTVPSTVNGKPNEDTYSIPYFDGFNAGTGWGGQVQTAGTDSRVLKSITTQLDVFACERGEYQLENCYTIKPNKKFTQEWNVSVYEVGAGEEPGALVASGSTLAKLHYRPTTNVSCPATSEGKGFGSNCDVGGLLQTIGFKHFAQSKPLPPKAIVLLTNKCDACAGKSVNVGTFTSYKEYNPLLLEPFVAEPPANGGVPAVGSDPLPNSAYAFNKFEATGWGEYQPVFEIEVK